MLGGSLIRLLSPKAFRGRNEKGSLLIHGRYDESAKHLAGRKHLRHRPMHSFGGINELFACFLSVYGWNEAETFNCGYDRGSDYTRCYGKGTCLNKTDNRDKSDRAENSAYDLQ